VVSKVGAVHALQDGRFGLMPIERHQFMKM
jgi:hypothetical protein